eukprot:GHVP01048505.1.p1 GENE.GHVP01048505.1~~GHVP01048505.1.p1  ORF type:complete len:119 (-),score=2.92 GHVP01048505.1:907-1263(-)
MPSKLESAILVTDYSPRAIGAVLYQLQETFPVACLSERLTESMKISTCHGEALASLKFALWTQQLFGRTKLVILTDGKSAITWLLEPAPYESLLSSLQRLRVKLAEYPPYTAKHIDSH